jgi:tetratricopeptide (TPR) repeat protein
MDLKTHENQTKKLSWINYVNRFGILLIILILVSMPFVDYQKLYYRVRLKVLNRLRPSSVTYLLNFAKNPHIKDDDRLAKYQFYYQHVYDLMPNRMDALGLYGYCSYYLGQPEEAREAYEQALEINPHFFWFYHNLGIIHFQQGDYDQAVAVLSEALNTRPENVFRVISLSPRIYMPLVKGRQDAIDQARLTRQIKRGYRNVYLLLIKSLQEKEAYQRMLQTAMKAIEAKLDGAGNFHFYAGLALYRLQKFEQATLFYKKCLEKNPKHAEALKYFGILSTEMGSRELGLKMIQKATYLTEAGQAYRLDPNTIDLQPY